MLIRPFDPSQTEQVVALWESCGLVRAWNDPRRDIARKLTVQPELFLVGTVPMATVLMGTEADASTSPVIASAMVGYDGHRGWVNYLAVASAHRGQGHARALMTEAEHLLTERGCPKLNLQIREGNDSVIGFYRALGYEPDHAVSLGKRLIAD